MPKIEDNNYILLPRTLLPKENEKKRTIMLYIYTTKEDPNNNMTIRFFVKNLLCYQMNISSDKELSYLINHKRKC